MRWQAIDRASREHGRPCLCNPNLSGTYQFHFDAIAECLRAPAECLKRETRVVFIEKAIERRAACRNAQALGNAMIARKRDGGHGPTRWLSGAKCALHFAHRIGDRQRNHVLGRVIRVRLSHQVLQNAAR